MARPDRFHARSLLTHSLGAVVQHTLAAALQAVEPRTAVLRHLARQGQQLFIGQQRYDLTRINRVFLLAIGKAALPMTRAALEVVGDRVGAGLVVSKDLDEAQASLPASLAHLTAGHPVPDERSVEAGQQAWQLLSEATADDLVIALISGGGSALLCLPRPGLTLHDLQTLTSVLLAAGAPINAVNTLRRQCDQVKGGGLLRAAAPAPVAALVLSDVLGDDLAAIASGPFVPVMPGAAAVRQVVESYGLVEKLPHHILMALTQAQSEQPSSNHADHTIIANVWTAAQAAAQTARNHGLEVTVWPEALVGEAREMGPFLIQQWDQAQPARPACLIAGGETTVTLRGDGRGGRNQELALAAVEPLAGHDLLLVTLATDGGDGPTDAAGAIVTGATLAEAQALGLDAQAFLARNDAYSFFAALDDLLRPGPTHTNVNDLTLLFRG